MQNKKEHDLDNDPNIQLIMRMTVPVMLAGLLTSTYGFVDMIFASLVGGVQVSFVSPLFILLAAIIRGFARGGNCNWR